MRRPKPEDVAFSRCVRERTNWTCERCGGQFLHNTSGLHCSHYVGRAARSTRWDPVNCFAHCYGCHSLLGSRPGEFTRWVQSRLGPEVEEALMRRGNDVTRVTFKQRQEIRAHYEREFARMSELRASGVMGRIEFSDWRSA